MKISEIPSLSQKYGFEFAFCTFLDQFYHSKPQEKYMFIEDEPPTEKESDEHSCVLAAAAHKLANDYHLRVPKWVFDEKYKMQDPVYPFGLKKEELDQEMIEIYQELSPYEYQIRNLFYGSQVLKRA
jgi:hypothetical protein